MNRRLAVRALVAAALVLPTGASAQTIFSSSGSDAASIQGQVDAFRAALGTLNPNVAGSVGSGRREINWDGVPDAFAAPNALPANFFNVNSPRGVVFSTPGTGFQVSASAASGTPVEFGNIEPLYPAYFAPFSAQRLFTAVGSNVVDVAFFVPGSTTAALVTGFGSVFSDVDVPNTTSIELFGLGGTALGTYYASGFDGAETFSFLGIFYATPTISRVRITNGSQVLAAGNTATDLVVMDDFIYGEPVAATAVLPEPGTWALFATGLVGLAGAARRRRD